MDRIQELLAKGIDKLTDDELVELQGLLHDEADRVLDEAGDNPSDEATATLETIADALDASKTEVTAREARAAERADKVKALADRIKGQADDDAGDDDGGEPAPVITDEADDDAEDKEPVATSAAGETVVEPVAEPIAASGGTAMPLASNAPVITNLRARRPEAARPRARQVEQAPMVASANVPGFSAGRRMTSDADIARAFDAAATALRSSRNDFKVPVLTASLDLPESRQLDPHDAHGNDRKIRAVNSPEAITASGGVCAPVPYRYDLPIVGTDARPVRDALARFGATRGGVKTLIPPTIADVSGAVGQWTMANDTTPTDPTTKPYLTISCDDSESATDVYAITQSFKVGNFRARWDTERVQAIKDLAGTWTSRYAEAKMLKTIKDGSKLVTHGQVLGTASDVFTSLRQLFVGIRYRHRTGRNVMLRCILPDWVRDNMLTDLIRLGDGSGTIEERLVRSESTLDAYFKAMNVNVSWHYDYEYGVAVGSNGGPFGGTQGVGSIIGYPDKARAYVFIEGSWLFLDGGSFDFGIIRDQTLVGTNDMLLFMEFMENAHYHGVPGETYAVDLNICANGGYASALDIAPCVSGS